MPAPWPVSAPSPTSARGGAGGLGAALIAGLVAAAAGFVEVSVWSTRTENGVLVDCSYTNVAPWIFGPVAIVCGLVALLGGRGRSRPVDGLSTARLPLATLVLVVGIVHLATALAGLDLLGRSPC